MVNKTFIPLRYIKVSYLPQYLIINHIDTNRTVDNRPKH